MTERLWNLFISHSTKSDPTGIAARLLDRLEKEFASSVYEVLVDRNYIEPAAQWRKKIMEMINRAHIGIVLLDANAFSSQWVNGEVAMMLVQLEERNFQIFPILINLEQTKVGRSKSSPFFPELMRHQTIDLHADDADPVETAVKIEQVVTSLKHLLTAAFDGVSAAEMKLVKEIAHYMPNDAAKAVELLKSPEDEQRLPRLTKEAVASYLLKARLANRVAEMFIAEEAHFLGLTTDQRDRLVELIEPSWIDPQAASILVPPVNARCRVGVLGTVNPLDQHKPPKTETSTGVHYIRRATHWDRRACEVESLDDEVPRGIEQFEAQLDAAHAAGVLPWFEDRSYDEPEDERTYYLVVRAGGTEHTRLDLVTAIHRLWPQVVVLLLIGGGANPDRENFAGRLGVGYVRLVDLDHQAERIASRNIAEIRKTLRCPRLQRKEAS